MRALQAWEAAEAQSKVELTLTPTLTLALTLALALPPNRRHSWCPMH